MTSGVTHPREELIPNLRDTFKTVVVPDNLGTAAETKAILDCIVHKRFFGEW